jgi:hypothetical protein
MTRTAAGRLALVGPALVAAGSAVAQPQPAQGGPADAGIAPPVTLEPVGRKHA